MIEQDSGGRCPVTMAMAALEQIQYLFDEPEPALLQFESHAQFKAAVNERKAQLSKCIAAAALASRALKTMQIVKASALHEAQAHHQPLQLIF